MATLIKEMLHHQRQFIIDKVKAPLLKAIITLARRYPEPTKENLIFRNSHIRLEIKDYFFKHFNNDGRKLLLEAAFRILIDECEHDGFYEFIHDTYIVELLKRGWQPTQRGFPMYRYWNGSLPKDTRVETHPDWLEKVICLSCGKDTYIRKALLPPEEHLCHECKTHDSCEYIKQEV